MRKVYKKYLWAIPAILYEFYIAIKLFLLLILQVIAIIFVLFLLAITSQFDNYDKFISFSEKVLRKVKVSIAKKFDSDVKKENQAALPPMLNKKVMVVNNKVQIVKQPTINKGATKSLKMASSENIIKLYPKQTGSAEFLIWGYDYPIMINLVVKDKLSKDNKEKHYKFIDYKQRKNLVMKYESSYHEKVLEKLLKALYNKKIPRGYQKVITKEIYEDKPNNLFFSLLLKLNII